MAEGRIVKFCARVGPRSLVLVMTNCPQWKTNRYMAYQMAATAVTLKVIRWLQAFSNAIRRTFVQYVFYTISTECARAVPLH